MRALQVTSRRVCVSQQLLVGNVGLRVRFKSTNSPKEEEEKNAAKAAANDIFSSLFGEEIKPQKEKTSGDEAQRMKDVDAIFESLFGKSRKKTDLQHLKYFKLYPKMVKRWVEDAKTAPGYFDKDGNWQSVRVSNDYRKEQPSITRDATVGLPQRKDLPEDLAGQYRFGLTEADLANASGKVKDVLSFRWANQKEITAFRAHKMRAKFGRDVMDTGSSEVQVSMMTVRVRALTEHMRANPKDKRTKRALTSLVCQRQRLMKYMKRTDVAKYYEVITSLGLRDMV